MDEQLQVKIYGANDDGIKLVMKHYNKSEKDIEDGVNIIMDWYKQQRHLPQDAFDIPTVARYYANTKYSIENTKQKLENYCTLKGMCPEYFTNRDPLDSKFNLVIKHGEWCLLPELTPENYRVIILRYTDKDVSKLDQDAFHQFIIMHTDMRMRYECCVGEIHVWDLKHVGLGHALKVTPIMIKKMVYLAQECYSARLKEIHIVNFSPHVTMIFNIFKRLLKKKMANRIHMHNSLEELHKHVSPKYLPVELGGLKFKCEELCELALSAMQTEYWRKYFIDSEKKLTDESKRPPNSKNKVGNDFGIMGSFRNIEID